jgi:HAE1 family hydrophobic/amphiphilic exporter-1
MMIGLLIGLVGIEASAQQATRVGIDAAKTRLLTLRDAITAALENNHDIEIERINVQMNEFDLRASEGVYDPKLSTGLYFDHRSAPVASLLAGGDNGKLNTSDFAGTAKLAQRLPWQGASVSATFDQSRATTDNQFFALNPQFTTSLNFEFTQPLWRNRRIDGERRQIKIAKKRLDLSDSQFRQRAIEIIASVERAYWDLVFARRDEEIKREAVEWRESSSNTTSGWQKKERSPRLMSLRRAWNWSEEPMRPKPLLKPSSVPRTRSRG